MRVVPRVERSEFINAGVIVYCPTQSFLACSIHLDPGRLAALDTNANAETIGQHLEGLRLVCVGADAGGPIAALPLRERFHWLVHPRSAILQFSAVHAGATEDLGETLV
ncbi:MAG: DUF3037 domain-containing protein, partial [Nannocystaceae bacterium]|nr:DUF3037 domain-containing protein [Nannocystaceae bacterium]